MTNRQWERFLKLHQENLELASLLREMAQQFGPPGEAVKTARDRAGGPATRSRGLSGSRGKGARRSGSDL